jgi:hypothetical protein
MVVVKSLHNTHDCHQLLAHLTTLGYVMQPEARGITCPAVDAADAPWHVAHVGELTHLPTAPTINVTSCMPYLTSMHVAAAAAAGWPFRV